MLYYTAQLLLPLLVAERGGGAHRRAAGAAFGRASSGCLRTGRAARSDSAAVAPRPIANASLGQARTRPAGEPHFIGDARLAFTRGALFGPEVVLAFEPARFAPEFQAEALDDAKQARLFRGYGASSRCPSLRNAAQCRAD